MLAIEKKLLAMLTVVLTVSLSGAMSDGAVVLWTPGQGVATTYDFDSYQGTAAPTDWDITTTSYRGQEAGAQTIQGTRAYGTTEYALGFLGGSNANHEDGNQRIQLSVISFTNATGLDITDFTVAYTAEQWRYVTDGLATSYDVSYTIDGGSDQTLSSLAYSASAAGGTNGVPTETELSEDVAAVIPDGSTIEIEFFAQRGPTTNDDPENANRFTSQGIAIDDFSFTYTTVPEPASVALLGTGACLILARRRKQVSTHNA